MQNEFEKQVQQKMEELKLVPSEPVWQKVEMQIRKKKDRRRLILWLPLLVLLLGGGLWIGIEQYSNNVAFNKPGTERQNQQIQKQNSNLAPEQITASTPGESNQQDKLIDQPINKNYSGIHSTPKHENSVPFVIKKISPQKIDEKKNGSISEEKKSSSEKETISNDTKIPETAIAQQPVQITITTDSSFSSSQNKDTSSVADKKVSEEIKVTTKENDSTTAKPAIKKQAAAKWKYALAVNAGRSGSGRLNVFEGFFGGQKSMDYAANPNGGPTGGQIFYPPSDVKKGFSFSVEALAKKQLGKRTSFSAGLGYNYYSNSILVGNMVSQNATIGRYSVSQYYLNNAVSGPAATFKSYHNRYQFVALPLALDWQLLKKLPLNLSTGLSFQYLIQTNGLVFDYNRQAYFHDKDAFSRFQSFYNVGLHYSIPLKKNTIAIGPEWQYGLSPLEKGNTDHHLFMYGLKAQWVFGKK